MPLPRNFSLSTDEKSRLGTQLLRLAKRYDRALEGRLAPWHLGPTHYEILKVLYSAPDYSLRHSQLGAALGITLPSVTVAIRKLTALGLIGQRRGIDRRERIASLSVKGAEMLSHLYESNEGFAESVFSSVDDKDAKGLQRVLTTLLARLSALEDRAAA
ncbi:MAG: MarR family transcriptional regulator [Planctomycetes bacterium]|nr:MarR family transcriptional regulator [Planctomycetota bacterium]